MKKAILFISLLYTSFSFAQKERNIWCFGNNAGLDFNSGSPVSFAGVAMNTTEGSSSIADSAGNLLFYTDGITVYNKNHGIMPNGTNLAGGQSSTQSGLIVQQPGSNSIYYVFTPAESPGTGGLCYSIVDMTLQSGLGDVTTKNVLLFTPSTEKITGTHHSNGQDVWIVGHPLGNNDFYSYLLTSTGLSAPVITSVGDAHTAASAEIGYMKISPDGKHLALAIRYQFVYQLFDFDASTGIVSNPISIPSGLHCYGVEFSPDNTKLYLSGGSGLFQFDITSNNSATINASKFTVSNNTWAIQLAPDKKIYCARLGGSYLDVINNPNQAGAACNWQANAVLLSSGSCELGLPNCIFDSVTAVTGTPPIAQLTSNDSIFCDESGRCINFFDQSVNSPTSWQWKFPGATPDTSTMQNPAGICYTVPGTYSVTLIVSNNSGTDSITITPKIIFGSGAALPVLTVSHDTIFSSHATTYQWYYNGLPIPGATDSFYVAAMAGSYNVFITDDMGCSRLGNSILFTFANELSSTDEEMIYPNPAKDHFTISFAGNGNKVKITISDITGKTICSSDTNETRKIEVSTKDFAEGIYFVRIQRADFIVTKKLIVVK